MTESTASASNSLQPAKAALQPDRGPATALSDIPLNQTRAIKSQPTMRSAMTLDARNPKQLPRNAENERQWSHSLYACCDRPIICIEGTFCGCFIYGDIRQRLNYLEDLGQPLPPDERTNFNSECCMYCVIAATSAGFCACLLNGLTRQHISNRYVIHGNYPRNALIGFFCRPCDFVQQSREIEEEELALGKHHEMRNNESKVSAQ